MFGKILRQGGGIQQSLPRQPTDEFDWKLRDTSRKNSDDNIAIGNLSGEIEQGLGCVAIGIQCGNFHQKSGAVAIGTSSGKVKQGKNAVAIGVGAGNSKQGCDGIAIGGLAGKVKQGKNAVAIGIESGQNKQGIGTVAIGARSARLSQGDHSICIGADSEATGVVNSICIGSGATATRDGQLVIGSKHHPISVIQDDDDQQLLLPLRLNGQDYMIKLVSV